MTTANYLKVSTVEHMFSGLRAGCASQPEFARDFLQPSISWLLGKAARCTRHERSAALQLPQRHRWL